MKLRWHVFYLGIIAALVAALLFQGSRTQRAALAAQQAVAAADLYQAIRQTPARYQLVDLREAAEFEDGHLPQAVQCISSCRSKRVRRSIATGPR